MLSVYHFHWRHTGARRDVSLGDGYLADRPIIGDMIAFSSINAPGQATWRVVDICQSPLPCGPRDWADPADPDLTPWVDVILQPCDGPFYSEREGHGE